MPKRKKKSPKELAKDYAWKWFSRWQRTQECLEQTGELNKGYCVTCKTPLSIKKLQAGHGVSSRCNAVLFVPELVHNQCWLCNMKKHGAYDEYCVYLINKYGYERYRELLALKKVKKNYTIEQLKDLGAEFKDNYYKLIEDHNV